MCVKSQLAWIYSLFKRSQERPDNTCVQTSIYIRHHIAEANEEYKRETSKPQLLKPKLYYIEKK